MRSPTDWIESLSPWPRDGFGLDRMRELLERLGNPQRAYPAIHVVGTNGKSTTARMAEALLEAEGWTTGTYLSPHVSGWSERIRVRNEEADFDAAVARIRPASEALGATQFEALTAAALLEFARSEVDVAIVEAGLGGRHDATNVLESRVTVLTNVALEHTQVLGDTREAIAREKLAVVRPGSTAVLGEPEWVELARERHPAKIVVCESGNSKMAETAVSEFVGHPVDPAPARAISLPGRLEFRDGEIRDGAHTPDGLRHVAPHLPPLGAIVLSILEDKAVDEMLRELSRHSDTLVATTSTNPRALPAGTLAARARAHFEHVEAVDDPVAAVARAHELGSPVLVTGSLYLLADLAAREEETVRCRTFVSG